MQQKSPTILMPVQQKELLIHQFYLGYEEFAFGGWRARRHRDKLYRAFLDIPMRSDFMFCLKNVTDQHQQLRDIGELDIRVHLPLQQQLKPFATSIVLQSMFTGNPNGILM